MQIINNRILLVKTRFPSRITETIKKSKVVQKEGDVSEVAVNWGLQEAQTLQKLNIRRVPSPIVRDYDWPGLFKPKNLPRSSAG